MCMKLSEITIVGSRKIGQFVIKYFNEIIAGKKWKAVKDVHQVYANFIKAYDSIRIQSLWSIMVRFGIPQKNRP